jgi:hypothetical protein
MKWWVVCSVSGVLLACGARVTESPASGVGSGGSGATGATGAGGTNEPGSDASGGVSPSAAGSGSDIGGSTNANAGGDSNGGVWSTDFSTRTNVPDGGTSCSFSYPVCGTLDSYVELQGDGGDLLLAYPGDPGCGNCRGSHCDLYAFARASCGVSIQVSACAGPGGAPPCLDTVESDSSSTYFIDGTGKRWAFASLGGTVSNWAGFGMSSGVLDVQTTLTFGDIGGVHYELPVHVRLCAGVQRTLPPC